MVDGRIDLSRRTNMDMDTCMESRAFSYPFLLGSVHINGDSVLYDPVTTMDDCLWRLG